MKLRKEIADSRSLLSLTKTRKKRKRICLSSHLGSSPSFQLMSWPQPRTESWGNEWWVTMSEVNSGPLPSSRIKKKKKRVKSDRETWHTAAPHHEGSDTGFSFPHLPIPSVSSLSLVRGGMVTERILKVTNNPGNRGRCRKLSLWECFSFSFLFFLFYLLLICVFGWVLRLKACHWS